MPLSTAGSDHDQRASPWSVQTTTRTDSDKWAARVIELAAPPSLVLEVAGQLVVCGLWAALVVAQSSSCWQRWWKTAGSSQPHGATLTRMALGTISLVGAPIPSSHLPSSRHCDSTIWPPACLLLLPVSA